MKKVYILRHSEWDKKNNCISPVGLTLIDRVKTQLPKFSIIKSSPVIRTIETARLLTGKNPMRDERASIIKSTPEQLEQIFKNRINNPAGTFGAIMGIPELVEALKNRSNDLAALIKKVLSELKDNERALIVSHDAIILGARIILTGSPFVVTNEKYNELCGFIINEKLKIKEFKPKT